MRDFKPNLLFNLGGHVVNLTENRTIDNSASRREAKERIAGERSDSRKC